MSLTDRVVTWPDQHHRRHSVIGGSGVSVGARLVDDHGDVRGQERNDRGECDPCSRWNGDRCAADRERFAYSSGGVVCDRERREWDSGHRPNRCVVHKQPVDGHGVREWSSNRSSPGNRDDHRDC